MTAREQTDWEKLVAKLEAMPEEERDALIRESVEEAERIVAAHAHIFDDSISDDLWWRRW